jgi:uncharacterized protein (TIGR03435 family)
MLGDRTIDVLVGPTLAVVLGALALTAVEAAQERPTFQLVSIRKAAVAAGAAAPRSSFTVIPGGRFEARGATIGDLARVAYGFEHMDPRSGVVDAPNLAWAEFERFDVTAAADGEWSKPPAGDRVPAELRAMMRALLEDRFALKANIQNKRIDVYALRLADKTAGPGPSLQRSADTCLGPFTISPAPAREAEKPRCPSTVNGSRIEAGAITLADLARILSGIPLLADRPIVDDTGLEGVYDVVVVLGLRGPIGLQRGTLVQGSNERVIIANSPDADRWKITVQKELKAQLGLELRKTKLPVPVLVIDRARRPQED